ncbi:MAG: sigma-70 factor domain-containing protein, partial [Actinomycetota bacterium]
MAKDRIDRDEEDLVRLYLTDIGQYVLLTKDDEVRLAKEIEEGKAAEKQLDNPARLDAQRKRELRKIARLGTRA